MGALLRLLIIGAIAWFIYTWLRRILQPPESAPPKTAQLMQKCAHCGVHIPEGESTQSQGQFFCCEDHRDRYLQSKS